MALFFVVNGTFALLTGLLAKRKNRKIFLWIIAGLLCDIIAFTGFAFFEKKDEIPKSKIKTSVRRELIFSWFVIVLGALRILFLGFCFLWFADQMGFTSTDNSHNYITGRVIQTAPGKYKVYPELPTRDIKSHKKRI